MKAPVAPCFSLCRESSVRVTWLGESAKSRLPGFNWLESQPMRVQSCLSCISEWDIINMREWMKLTIRGECYSQLWVTIITKLKFYLFILAFIKVFLHFEFFFGSNMSPVCEASCVSVWLSWVSGHFPHKDMTSVCLSGFDKCSPVVCVCAC